MLMMFLQKKLFKADTHASHAWHTLNKGSSSRKYWKPRLWLSAVCVDLIWCALNTGFTVKILYSKGLQIGVVKLGTLRILWTPSEPRVSVLDSESLICNSENLLRSKVSNLFCRGISLCQEIMFYYDLLLLSILLGCAKEGDRRL